MKNFIQEKVTNADIKLLLSEAIKGKGAFRRFNNHLCDYPETQQDWHAYREQESQKIVVKWLNENEINDFGLVDS
jgi:hypothetical protein